MERARAITIWLTAAVALGLTVSGCGRAATTAPIPVVRVSAVEARALPPAWLSTFIAQTLAKAGDPHPRLVQWALTTNGALVGRVTPDLPNSEGDPKARIYVFAMVGDFTSDGRGNPMSEIMGGQKTVTLLYIFAYASHTLLRVPALGGPHQLGLTRLGGAHDLTISWSTP